MNHPFNFIIDWEDKENVTESDIKQTVEGFENMLRSYVKKRNEVNRKPKESFV